MSYTSRNGNPENIFILSQKKATLMFREMENLKKLFVFQPETLKIFILFPIKKQIF